ncbi:hypothetical protein FHU30_005638 [Actinomadura rupiterrae]|nr:hypothetical protein [Actinomadura rupiterrae]
MTVGTPLAGLHLALALPIVLLALSALALLPRRAPAAA